MVVRNKPMLVFAAAILAALLIFWEYLNGGVVTHYPLADADNPGISNWWGLLTFPLLTWAALIIAEKRKAITDDEASAGDTLVLQKNYLKGGLAFGLLMGVLWELGQQEILQYLILTPWLLSFLLRIYLPETTLGFVLGMAYTFGGVLPVVFALVIQTVGFFIYLLFNRGGRWLYKSSRNWQSDKLTGKRSKGLF